MKTLFLDFCSHRKVLAVIHGSEVTETELADHTDEAAVLPAIDLLLRQANIPMENIGRIAAVTGPGGFMSQRVGLSIANALAWGLKIPIGGVHLSDIFRARISGDVIWIHSTKKQLLFMRGFGSYAQKWPEPLLMTLDDVKKVTEALYVGEVLPEQAAVLQIKPLLTLQELSAILPRLTETLHYGNTPILPWYGRGA